MKLIAIVSLLALAGCEGEKSTPDSGTPPTGDTSDTVDTIDTDSPPGPTGTGDTGGVVGPTPSYRDPKFDPIVDLVAAELEQNLAIGVSIAVWEDGAWTWQEGFGTASNTAEVAVTPDTVFMIGSTTKQLTSALMLQQVDQGLYSLDDTVGDVLPFSFAVDPSWSEATTLHQLLSHQGGPVDYVDWAGIADDAELAAWHYDFVAPFLYPMNPGGEFWNYSNPNFTLAGLVTESFDPGGRMWPDILEQELFEPLGMTRSYIRKVDVNGAPEVSESYGIDIASYETGPVRLIDVTDPASARPAGLAWSTPTDMTRWAELLMSGDPAILGDTARVAITTPHVDTAYYDGHMAYGYGEFVWDLYPLSDGWYPIRVWEHGGNTLSFTSVLVMLPDQGKAFSILSSGYGDYWPQTTEALIRTLVDPLPAPSSYTGPALDLTDLGSHVGSYLDPYNVGELTVAAGGTYGLTIDAPVLTDYGLVVDPNLVPGSTDVWYVFVDGEPYDLTFIREPGGGQDRWIRNRAFVAGRAEAAPPLVPRTPDPTAIDRMLRAARAPIPVRPPSP
ncbi:MAG: serine hydrolase domain-containing protein [Myxococcota bacterium]